jgi:hypothetical protein
MSYTSHIEAAQTTSAMLAADMTAAHKASG